MKNDRRHKEEIVSQWEYQNDLFGYPIPRWERYKIARKHFREGSPKEVFFERENPKTTQIMGTTKGDDNTRRGERDMVYGEGGVMGSLKATDYKQPPQILYDPYNRVIPKDQKNTTTLRTNHTNGNPQILVMNKGESQHYRLYDEKGIAPTLQSQSGMSSQKHPFIIADNNKTFCVRKLMPSETEALMSWPRDWTKFGRNEKGERVEISDSQRYRQCGNGVCSNVVKAIVKELLI